MVGLFFLNLILGVLPIASNCAAERRQECVDLMSAVYKSADPQKGSAVRIIERERWSAEPMAIVDLPGSRVLIVRHSKESGVPHVASGRWSAYYFKSAEGGPKLDRSYLDFAYSGSFGDPGHGTLARLDDASPAWVTDGGGTWQGDSCGWVSITTIEANGPHVLLPSILSSADHPDIEAKLVSPLSRTHMEVDYKVAGHVRRVTFTPGAQGRLLISHGAELRAC